MTAEGLEVLALATNTVFKDGDSIRDVIENVRASGAIPVLPWGLAMTGKRGRIISDLISDCRDREFFSEITVVVRVFGDIPGISNSQYKRNPNTAR